MSRSVKKSLICKDRNNAFYKKSHNRKVRKFNLEGDISEEGAVRNRNLFKKVTEAWNICDWKWRASTVQEFIENHPKKGILPDKTLKRLFLNLFRNK